MHPRGIGRASLSALLALALLFALTSTVNAVEAPAEWNMDNCHGLATLDVAPVGAVTARLPDGYTPVDAASFGIQEGHKPHLPGVANDPKTKTLVGVELWECDSITIGDVTVEDVAYASLAAVIQPPEGAPSATLYFYKFENFFSDPDLVEASEDLETPARLITSSHVEHTDAGAKGSFTLEDGGTYRLTVTDVFPLHPGSFQEWHKAEDVVANWQASFTVQHGHLGPGTVEAPKGSFAARIMGGPSGEGVGIHSLSDFDGRVTLDKL